MITGKDKNGAKGKNLRHRPRRLLERIQERHIDKLSTRVSQPTPTGCIEWQGATNSDGYAIFRLSGEVVLAHRVAWALRHGMDPGRYSVRHKCHNRKCVNPDHLRRGTHKQNMQDKVRRKQGAVRVSG